MIDVKTQLIEVTQYNLDLDFMDPNPPFLVIELQLQFLMNSIKMMYMRLISEFVGERVVYKLVRGSGCLREWVVE